jgi:hypothetical protein
MNQSDHAVQKTADKKELLNDPDALTGHISRRLYEISRNDYNERQSAFKRGSGSSAVLLLLGPQCGQNGRESCLILNKRSARVRQPGDICCPGGGITPVLDVFLSKLLVLPGLPLGRWPYWARWHGEKALNGGAMPLLLATGLREGFEEMRLNPLGFRFLGPMPPACLRVFRRKIYPMVGWVPGQRRFRPNWEVDRIVRIPLRAFWESDRYANYRVSFSRRVERRFNRKSDDFPCFMFENEGRQELLWGVTYRIIMNFMASVLEFDPPDVAHLPVISGRLRGSYITGR